MSVPTWKRSESKTEFLYLLYDLNKRMIAICMKKPSKYRNNYSDILIKTSLEALKNAQIANSIFFSKNSNEDDFMLRRRHLIIARGLIENVATVAEIYLEYVRDTDSVSNEKINSQENYIGSTCEAIHRKINGVIKSDAEIYKKYIK